MNPEAHAALLAAIHELTDEVRALRLLHEEGPEAAERRMRRARKARAVETAAKRAVEETRRAEAAKADAVVRAAGVDPDAAFAERKERERARIARELRNGGRMTLADLRAGADA